MCGTTGKISDLWEPRWQWDMDGLLCKDCFDKKEEDHTKKKNYCALCGTKMGLFRLNPKPKWKVDGQLCRKCWDVKKAEFG
jgi:ribosomal protein S14